MKKTLKHQFFHGKSVRLYRDGFEEILEVITKYCESVKISSGDYEYESLDELEGKQGANPTEVQIIGWSPYVYFHVSRGSMGRSWVSADGEGSETPYLLISKVLAENKRKWLRLTLHPLVCLVYFVIGAALVLIFREPITTHFSRIFLTVVCSSLALILLSYSYAVTVGQYSYISLRRKHEKSTFWMRNKDTILVGVMVAIITAFITWLITYLTTK
jgi:hypothetical protein